MNLEKRPAIFLDRDGVLSEEVGYVRSIEELHIFPYVGECIAKIKNKGYYNIVITNQSGIAQGLLSEDVLKNMNQYLIERTGVDAVYYCPHHPQGNIDIYKKVCRCRKPETGLLEQACEDFNIDLSKSYMVGDRACDVLIGQKAGLKTILLESGYGTSRLEQDVAPDYILEDLRKVVELL